MYFSIYTGEYDMASGTLCFYKTFLWTVTLDLWQADFPCSAPLFTHNSIQAKLTTPLIFSTNLTNPQTSFHFFLFLQKKTVNETSWNLTNRNCFFNQKKKLWMKATVRWLALCVNIVSVPRSLGDSCHVVRWSTAVLYVTTSNRPAVLGFMFCMHWHVCCTCIVIISFITLCPANFYRMLKDFANNKEQDAGPHLRSKLFDTQIIYLKFFWMKSMIFCQFLKEKKIEKNIDIYSACKPLDYHEHDKAGKMTSSFLTFTGSISKCKPADSTNQVDPEGCCL